MKNLTILIKGGGEMASGVSYRLSRCHFRVVMTEIQQPQAVRREVSLLRSWSKKQVNSHPFSTEKPRVIEISFLTINRDSQSRSMDKVLSI